MGSSSLYDILPATVQPFLKSNPPVQTWDGSERPELTAPLIFHERHLDARLMLKKVQIIPLERFMSLALDLTLKSVVEKHIELPKTDEIGIFDGEKDQELHETYKMSMRAMSVAQVYERNTSLSSCCLASTLLFHPRARQWSGTCLDWIAMDFEFYSAAALNCHGLIVRSLKFLVEGEKEVMDGDTCEFIEMLSQRRRPLAWWQIFFFDEKARTLLADLDRIASVGSFDAGRCQTYGYRSPPPDIVALPIDAPSTPWGTPMSSLFEESADSMPPMPQEDVGPRTKVHTKRTNHRVLRSRDKPPRYVEKEQNNRKSSMTQRNAVLWPKVQLLDRPADPMMDAFLLRAWAQSVEHDTTFIIFHCGNFERIGFRHRESQTLFISSLIDIHNCSDPSYGGLQAGLYLSIAQDAINRIKQQRELDKTKPKTRKRRRDPGEEEPTRRYKTRFMVAKERAEAEQRGRDYEAVKLHAPKRSLALVELRFGKYNSSAPAAFIQSGTGKKATYSSDEYMSLVLTSKLGYGSIGIVYDAQLELLVDGCIRRTRVAIKLGFKEEEVKSMRREYSIYRRLSRHGIVEGIPHVFGLYEDVESSGVALVMSYVGNCLWHLRPDKTKGYVRVSEAVEEAYIRILKNIHEADVCHGDIGEQNLMLTDDERPTIIDFDRAEIYPNQDEKDSEVRQLIALFRVKSPRPEPAADTPPSRDALDDLIAELEADLNAQNKDIERVSSDDATPQSPSQVDNPRNVEKDDGVNQHP
ncbi:hypothetical protein C0995_000984 [Termitomyces sp. Mi166|nr:hypothetical protein C0995_000984 [Termitomyces sp. Mi166\